MTVQLTDLPADQARVHSETAQQPAFWSGVFAMTLCVFALIASEFMPVSLLTPLAADLHVSQGLAGYGIAISGAFAVLTSLSISTLAGTMNRKTLLLALTALMCVSGLVIGAAPMTRPDTHISAVSASSRVLRFIVPASVEIDRLVSTAKAPEMAMP